LTLFGGGAFYCVIWFVTWTVTGLFLAPEGGPLLDLVIFIAIITLIELAVAPGKGSVRGKGEEPKPRREGELHALRESY
jgi:hypothetical protein